MKNYLHKLGYLTALVSACALLSGCEYALFDPKGPIGEQARDLIYISVGLMLIVVLPVLIMTVVIPWKFRQSNENAEYAPEWEHSNKIEAIVWGVPLLIIILLATVTYITSHSLDPRKPIPSDVEPMKIQVVAMDWKWLFIYPEERIATVNEIAIPVNRPVEFLITSDTVMNSFFIPRLGSQIYAMAGMENRLHLMASEEGVFRGVSANYSGFGFSGMRFKTIATSNQGYADWVSKVRQSPKQLTDEAYEELTHQTKDHPVEYFSLVNPLQFKNIIEKYTGVADAQQRRNHH